MVDRQKELYHQQQLAAQAWLHRGAAYSQHSGFPPGNPGAPQVNPYENLLLQNMLGSGNLLGNAAANKEMAGFPSPFRFPGQFAQFRYQRAPLAAHSPLSAANMKGSSGSGNPLAAHMMSNPYQYPANYYGMNPNYLHGGDSASSAAAAAAGSSSAVAAMNNYMNRAAAASSSSSASNSERFRQQFDSHALERDASSRRGRGSSSSSSGHTSAGNSSGGGNSSSANAAGSSGSSFNAAALNGGSGGGGSSGMAPETNTAFNLQQLQAAYNQAAALNSSAAAGHGSGGGGDSGASAGGSSKAKPTYPSYFPGATAQSPAQPGQGFSGASASDLNDHIAKELLKSFGDRLTPQVLRQMQHSSMQQQQQEASNNAAHKSTPDAHKDARKAYGSATMDTSSSAANNSGGQGRYSGHPYRQQLKPGFLEQHQQHHHHHQQQQQQQQHHLQQQQQHHQHQQAARASAMAAATVAAAARGHTGPPDPIGNPLMMEYLGGGGGGGSSGSGSANAASGGSSSVLPSASSSYSSTTTNSEKNQRSGLSNHSSVGDYQNPLPQQYGNAREMVDNYFKTHASLLHGGAGNSSVQQQRQQQQQPIRESAPQNIMAENNHRITQATKHNQNVDNNGYQQHHQNLMQQQHNISEQEQRRSLEKQSQHLLSPTDSIHSQQQQQQRSPMHSYQSSANTHTSPGHAQSSSSQPSPASRVSPMGPSPVQSGPSPIHPGPSSSHPGPSPSHSGLSSSHTVPSASSHTGPSGSLIGPSPTHTGPSPSHTGPGPSPSHTGPSPSHQGLSPSYSGPSPSHPGPSPSHPGPSPSHPGPSPSHPGPSPSHPGPSPSHPGPSPSHPGPSPSHPGPSPSHPGPSPTQPVPSPSYSGPSPSHPGPSPTHTGPSQSHPLVSPSVGAGDNMTSPAHVSPYSPNNIDPKMSPYSQSQASPYSQVSTNKMSPYSQPSPHMSPYSQPSPKMSPYSGMSPYSQHSPQMPSYSQPSPQMLPSYSQTSPKVNSYSSVSPVYHGTHLGAPQTSPSYHPRPPSPINSLPSMEPKVTESNALSSLESSARAAVSPEPPVKSSSSVEANLLKKSNNDSPRLDTPPGITLPPQITPTTETKKVTDEVSQSDNSGPADETNVTPEDKEAIVEKEATAEIKEKVAEATTVAANAIPKTTASAVTTSTASTAAAVVTTAVSTTSTPTTTTTTTLSSSISSISSMTNKIKLLESKMQSAKSKANYERSSVEDNSLKKWWKPQPSGKETNKGNQGSAALIQQAQQQQQSITSNAPTSLPVKESQDSLSPPPAADLSIDQESTKREKDKENDKVDNDNVPPATETKSRKEKPSSKLELKQYRKSSHKVDTPPSRNSSNERTPAAAKESKEVSRKVSPKPEETPRIKNKAEAKQQISRVKERRSSRYETAEESSNSYKDQHPHKHGKYKHKTTSDRHDDSPAGPKLDRMEVRNSGIPGPSAVTWKRKSVDDSPGPGGSNNGSGSSSSHLHKNKKRKVEKPSIVEESLDTEDIYQFDEKDPRLSPKKDPKNRANKYPVYKYKRDLINRDADAHTPPPVQEKRSPPPPITSSVVIKALKEKQKALEENDSIAKEEKLRQSLIDAKLDLHGADKYMKKKSKRPRQEHWLLDQDESNTQSRPAKKVDTKEEKKVEEQEETISKSDCKKNLEKNEPVKPSSTKVETQDKQQEQVEDVKKEPKLSVDKWYQAFGASGSGTSTNTTTNNIGGKSTDTNSINAPCDKFDRRDKKKTDKVTEDDFITDDINLDIKPDTSFLEIPPEVRRKVRPNFGGLIHFNNEWSRQIRRHHDRCRLPKQLDSSVRLKPKALAGQATPRKSYEDYARKEMVSPPHLQTLERERLEAKAYTEISSSPPDQDAELRSELPSIVETILANRKKLRQSMKMGRMYQIPFMKEKKKMRMRMRQAASAQSSSADSNLGLLLTPGLPLLTEDTKEVLLGTNPTSSATSFGNFRPYTLNKYLDYGGEVEKPKYFMYGEPEVFDSKTRSKANEKAFGPSISEIFGRELPDKTSDKKSAKKDSKKGKKSKELEPKAEPTSPPPPAPAPSSLEFLEKLKEKAVAPAQVGKEDEVFAFSQEVGEPTEEETNLQSELGGLALDLLDTNPSWQNQVTIQNLVVWEPIEPVPASVKKKKPKKKRGRKSGLDFTPASRRRLNKTGGSCEVSRASSPVHEDEGEVHDISYSLDQVVQESMRWVVDKRAGETILQRAAKMGYPDVIAYALNMQDHTVKEKDFAGFVPLDKAALKGHHEAVKTLLRCGADPSSGIKGTKAIHDAVESGSLETIYLLLSYGADPLHHNYSGSMPIDLANLAADKRMQQYLTNLLADLHGKPPPVPRGSIAAPQKVTRWNVSHHPEFHEPDQDPKYASAAAAAAAAASTSSAAAEKDEVDGDGEPSEDLDDLMFEVSSHPLPTEFQFLDREGDFVMYRELKDFAKKFGHHKSDIREKCYIIELKKSEFLRTARCKAIDRKINLEVKFHEREGEDSIILVRVDKFVRKIYNSERVSMTR